MKIHTLTRDINVPKGHGIVFRGDFIHAGMKWDEEEPHKRLFVYVNSKLSPRSKGTYSRDVESYPDGSTEYEKMYVI